MAGCRRLSCLPLLALALVLFHCSVGPADAQKRRTSRWQTLDGNAPLVIAKGGHSGLFPGYSRPAYVFAIQSSLPGTLSWCDVQLTKDNQGICLSDVILDNSTVVSILGSNRSNYSVNGVIKSGYFTLDFNSANISSIMLLQGIYSRAPYFDGWFPIVFVNNLTTFNLSGIWLNFQYSMFYSQHKLNMTSYLVSLAKTFDIDVVSSPEISFLKGIAATFGRSKTQLVFRFMEAGATEPSTKQTYGSLLSNLTFIKSFASGILVPKSYIWPYNASFYLLPSTSVVLDAHKAGLRIFAADFANDYVPLAYDYNYDPIMEYRSFIDKGAFSVDGVLTDSPITASAAIGCFSHINVSRPITGNPVVISNCGTSGVYPGCTDLAYAQAVEDGVDFIDCPVQVTKDGVLVCMSSVDLFSGTNVATSSYATRRTLIPQLRNEQGVFTFNLTWDEIQGNLKPQIGTPFLKYSLVRNPLKKNAGTFMSLANFLTFAKDKALSGVLISIENAVFLAENLGVSVTDGVLKALSDAGFNQTNHKVIIHSSESAVLMKMKQLSRYELMYKIDDSIRNALPSAIKDISEFAHSVAIPKQSIYPDSLAFIVEKTDLVTKFQKANISVYAYLFMNEFVSQSWDFFSDAIAEINTFVQDAGITGVITDYPGTSVSYKANTCLNSGSNTPPYMAPVQPGGLVAFLQDVSGALPPALPPMPPLTDADVVEPPLPNPLNKTEVGSRPPSPSPPESPNAQPPATVPPILCLLAIIVASCSLV